MGDESDAVDGLVECSGDNNVGHDLESNRKISDRSQGIWKGLKYSPLDASLKAALLLLPSLSLRERANGTSDPAKRKVSDDVTVASSVAGAYLYPFVRNARVMAVPRNPEAPVTRTRSEKEGAEEDMVSAGG